MTPELRDNTFCLAFDKISVYDLKQISLASASYYSFILAS